MQLKKIIAIFLAAALIFSVPMVNVGAESLETFEVGVVAESATPVSTSPEIIKNGDDVSVKISVAQNTGITFLRFIIAYDNKALDYANYTSKALFGQGESIQVKDGYLIFYYNSSNTLVNKGEMLELNFKVKAGYCGETKITTRLVQNNAGNCANYNSETGVNTKVPFVAGEDSFLVHAIDNAGEVTPATCTEDGYTTYICATCKEKVVGNVVKAAGHKYSEKVTAPTCTEKGYTTHTCSVCNDSYVDTYVNPLGHAYAEKVDAKYLVTAADCCHKAVYYKSCTDCGVASKETFEYGEFDSSKHVGGTVVKDAVEATCGADGYTGDTYCLGCNTKLSSGDSVPATGKHIDADGGKWESDENGHFHTCSCGAIFDRENHEVGTKATCVSKAVCAVCEASFGEVDAANHVGETEVRDAKAATCTEDGYTGDIYCKDCQAKVKEGEVVAKLGHKTTTTTTKATLSANGKIVTTCKTCKKVLSTVAISRVKTVKLAGTSYAYTAKYMKPAVTVTDYAGKALKNGTDYTVAYKNNKYVGTATATVTFKGKYSGSKALTFTIRPKATSLRKITPGTKQLKVNWFKNRGGWGYQLQYSSTSKFSSSKYLTFSSDSTLSTTIKNLKSKQTYYVRVRTYKVVKGKKIYSDWSKVLKGKTKQV